MDPFPLDEVAFERNSVERGAFGDPPTGISVHHGVKRYERGAEARGGPQLAALSFALPVTVGSLLTLLLAPPVTLPIHLVWLWLLSALGVAAGRALEHRWPALLGAWAGAIVWLCLLVGPAVSGQDRLRVVSPTESFGPVLTFTSDRQAAERTVALPNEWQGRPVFLRVDLARAYTGTSRLRAEVNGAEIGTLSPTSASGAFEPPGGAPAWAIRVPLNVLEAAPAARVVLRPTAADTDLAIAIHPDERITPSQLGPSRFFDGTRWLEDRLAGATSGPLRGAYRIWLQAA